MLVRRVAALCDDAFPALAAGALPRPWIVEPLDKQQRRMQRQRLEQRAAVIEWQRCELAAVKPEHVEDVVRDDTGLAPDAGRLAIEDDIARGEPGDRLDNGGIALILREPV